MKSPGSAACDVTIHNLIKRTARRLFSNGDLDPTLENCSARLRATQSSMPDYYQLERFFDREEYHARLQTFINVGAVSVDWDRGAGERGQVACVTMVDPAAAANVLGIDLPWKIALKAIDELKAVAREGLPPINHVIDGWRYGKAPGGITPDKANQFVDSMRVIEAAQHLGGGSKDLLLRRVSAQLFGNTKRIESLARQIAFLMGDSIKSEYEDVFAHLGLVKHPQPMLISGPSSCHIQLTGANIQLVKPYLGLRPDIIQSAQVNDVPIQQVMTIENLASFNEAAQDKTNPNNLLLIYVAGNPTPSLLSAYKKLLASLNPSCVMHWGDIDVGGFRIAARLAESALVVGHKLKLWRMQSPEGRDDQNTKVNESQIDQIAAICERYGWIQELARLKQYPFFQEQEFTEWKHPVI